MEFGLDEFLIDVIKHISRAVLNVSEMRTCMSWVWFPPRIKVIFRYFAFSNYAKKYCLLKYVAGELLVLFSVHVIHIFNILFGTRRHAPFCVGERSIPKNPDLSRKIVGLMVKIPSPE